MQAPISFTYNEILSFVILICHTPSPAYSRESADCVWLTFKFHPFSDAPFALGCRPMTETKCYINCEIGPSIATHVKRRDPSRFCLQASRFLLPASSSALCPLRSGERRLRCDPVIVVVGDVLTAYHDRISAAGVVARPAVDAGAQSTLKGNNAAGGVAGPAGDAGKVVEGVVALAAAAEIRHVDELSAQRGRNVLGPETGNR